MEKIVQTAGRDKLGDFAPEFAHYNDDILFGENWNVSGFLFQKIMKSTTKSNKLSERKTQTHQVGPTNRHFPRITNCYALHHNLFLSKRWTNHQFAMTTRLLSPK